jgi:ribonucleoside-diphosphate reductase alpha chain
MSVRNSLIRSSGPKMIGPQVPFSNELHTTKYRQPGEDFRASQNRVANGLKDSPEHYHEIREIFLDMRFMPAGRVQSAIGAAKIVTPYNCFVSGTISDSFVDGAGSIMQRATEAATTMRLGGGIGYDFSSLRPKGDLIKKLMSQASGAVSFMHIYDAICKCIASSGHRRGAQMGVLRIDHPDIFEFIHVKQTLGVLEGFNLSIGITNEFMECLASGKPFALQFGGIVYRYVDAQELWDTVMRATWDWAEPGVLFIDTINKMNNLYYCETIAATNPCGEQPLPPFGACLLGSFNLVKYVRRSTHNGGWYFDWQQLTKDIPPIVRAMDNVVDRATYPLPEQRLEALNKRRMGLGVTGLANAAEALGYAYGTKEFLQFEDDVLGLIRDETYLASAYLAKEKGAFPLYDAEKYLAGEFVKTLREDVQYAIKKYGIRNSHLTSIAPTGTISLSADNVSSGIEPVFDYGFDRTVMEFGGARTERVEDYGYRVFGVRGKRARDVTAQEHVDVLVHAAKRVDSAVSKTCNVSPNMPWEDFKGLYVSAWEGGAKGCTTFNSGGKRMGILVADANDHAEDEVVGTAAEEPTYESCTFDPATGRKSCE